MQSDTEFISKEKSQALEAELERLKTVERRAVAEHLEFATSLGDLSENAEYHEAKQEQADLEDRIKKIESILRNAIVVGKHKGTAIEVGCVVSVRRDRGAVTAYTLVGAEEANLAEGKLSYRSPLGAALVGKAKGDTVTVQTPRGEVHYTIVDVN